MADSLKQRDAVSEATGSNPELKDWTFALYTHLLDNPDQEGLKCTIQGVEYHICVSALEEGSHQFVSIMEADGAGDETAFFVKAEDQMFLNTFSGSGEGLPFLKDICRELGVSIKNSQSATKGVAAKVADTL